MKTAITWGLRTMVWPNSQEFRLLRDGTADGDEAKAQYKRLGRCDGCENMVDFEGMIWWDFMG